MASLRHALALPTPSAPLTPRPVAWRLPLVPLSALLSLLVLWPVSACVPAPRSVGSPGISDDEVTDLARLLQFEDHRRYDAAAFDALLEGRDETVRSAVALAAGRIGEPAAAPLLLRVLASDPSPAVRADAAFALGLLGITSPAILAGLEAAAPVDWVPARDDEVPVVGEVLSALGRLRDARSRSMVHAALEASAAGDSPRHRAVASQGLLTVWKFDGGPGNVRAALRYLDSPDSELRWRAAYALMRGGDPSALRPLLDHRDDDHQVRAYTARALTRQASGSAGVTAPALDRLEVLLRDPHPHVRINAVLALAGYGERAPLRAMAALLHDPDPMAGIAAAGALGALGPRALEPLAASVVDTGLPLPLRGAILAAMAPLAPEAAAATALDWSRRDAQHRYLAARALSGIPDEAAPGLTARLTADPDRRVVLAALGAVAERRGSPADSARLVATAARLGAAHEAVPDPGAPASTRKLDEDPSPAEDQGLAFYEEIVRRYVVPILSGMPRPRVRIETEHGPITLELLADAAPLTVHNFMTLAGDGFFNEGVWHRVVPNFVLQDGAPGGYPDGGPGWSIRDEINRHRYQRGVLGMALSGPDTGGSQWFITHSPQPHLDGTYTVFGRVVEGMDAADAVLQGEFIPEIRVLQ